MGCRILIKLQEVEIEAVLNNTSTAREIEKILPISGEGILWGEELYFYIPHKIPPENPKETVNKGDLGYWPTGGAFCIFFGPTPLSRGDEIRPASGVNVFGKLSEGCQGFKKIKSSTTVRVHKL